MNDKVWYQYEQYVRGVIADLGIAGVAVAVEQDGKAVYTGVFGLRNIAENLPVTPDTVFGCASISKSFTAMAITQLADKGNLSTDDPVTQHLPEFGLRGMDSTCVKVKHLLSHTTGLPPMARRPEIKTYEEHMEYLRTADYELLGLPGEYFSYCNDTFLLLGAIIERLSGMPYREYMTENILRPIGMSRTTYDIREVPVMGNYTDLYVKHPQTRVLESKPWVELGLYEVGGGVRSHVGALLRYGRVYTNGGVIDGVRIASEQGLSKMQQPMYRTQANTSYCFALQATPNHAGVTLVEHGGGQPGVSSNFGFVPEKKIVVSVLTNVTGMPANSIWLAAINAALGLPIDKKRADLPLVNVPAGELMSYEGSYRCAEGSSLRVYMSDNKLMLEMEGEKLPLAPTLDSSFTYFSAGQERAIRFFLRGGKAWAAFNHSRMLQRVS